MAQILGWQYQLSKLALAIKQGASVVFTSRDYIFKEASRHIKQGVFPLLGESHVIVNVTDLTREEKGQILYNHIKFGTLTKPNKVRIKPFLAGLVRDENFAPEVARRLGDQVFFSRISLNTLGLKDFMRRMGEYFRELVETLDESHQAALVLVALHNNRLASPIQEGSLPASFKEAYGATVSEIKSALEEMQGSLVMLSTIRGDAEWSLHHPSMLDAIQSMLSSSPEKVELFLMASSIGTLLRDTTTLEPDAHRVFVPQAAWPVLAERLRSAVFTDDWNLRSSAAGYLFRDASEKFLGFLWKAEPDLLMRAVTPRFTNLSRGFWYGLARKLREFGLWSASIEDMLITHIERSVLAEGDMRFLDNEDVAYLLGDQRRDNLVDEVLRDDCEILHDVVSQWDEIDEDRIDDFLQSLTVLEEHLADAETLTDETASEIHRLRATVEEMVPDTNPVDDDDDDEFARYRAVETAWKSSDMFSDVDE